MSSAEDDLFDGQDESLAGENAVAQGLKKRRVQRACDICRRKKGALPDMFPYTERANTNASVPSPM